MEASGSSAFDLSTYGESFSISMWVKAESYATGDFNAFVSKGGAYRVSRQNSLIYFNVAPDSGGFGGDSAYIAHGGTGTWQHFVFVFDGEKLNDASYVSSGQVPTKIYRNASVGTSYRGMGTKLRHPLRRQTQTHFKLVGVILEMMISGSLIIMRLLMA